MKSENGAQSLREYLRWQYNVQVEFVFPINIMYK